MTKRFGCLILVFLLGTVPVSAHDRTTPDPDDSAGRLDIEKVLFQHDMPIHDAPSAKIVRITITFYEPHGLLTEDGGIRLNMRPADRDEGGQRRILVEHNPDGSLFAAIDAGPGLHFVGFGRAWVEDERTFVIEIIRSQLPPKADRIKWRLRTSYSEPGVCVAEAGSSYLDECLDIVPGPTVDDDTWVNHDLTKY